MPRTILIVDDVTSNRLILREMLKKEYDILEAACGEDALDILNRRHESISAVLLDISMPGIDGYEVLRRVRADKHFPLMPVIMITGSEDEASRVKSLSLGVNDYVMKPYSSEIIKHCLQNNIALREASDTVTILERDRLTGIWNRDAFFARAARQIEKAPAGVFVLGCLDIEGFKVVNDQYGSDKGDEILKCIADALQASCDNIGGICGRISADQFVSLFPHTLLGNAPIGPDVLEARAFEKTGIRLTLSVGRYVIEDKSLSLNAMYDRAAIAKSTIKGRYGTHVAVYDESMRAKIVHEQAIVNEMNAALESRQFEVWFQPQYNHATNAMIGSEALVRWRHPQRGLIPPNDFIPIFEQNGFIYDMDKFMWEEVCRCLRRWLDENRSPLPVSVNISRYDMLCPDLVETIVRLTDAYRLPRELLRLEVTESAFSKSSQQIVNVVKEMVGLGFTVEIDDFGSGYSSLNTLKDVPAQIIKLDMKFLESSEDSQRGGSIVESIVRMAKWLGISVIAEGVETIEQADYLRSIGCNYMQGYLYARPMSVEQYEAHCSGGRKEEHLLTVETVEHLDNNAFWNPKSMDTLIFNSYVGAACIFEFSDDKIEVIRSTERFAEMISGSAMTVEDTLKLDWSAHLDKDNRKKLQDALQRSTEMNTDATVEFLFSNLPGCPEKTYIRATMRVIATAGKRRMVYNIVENITGRREAEREVREASEQMQTLMSDTPGGFVRMRMHPDLTGRIEYANDGFCDMLGMNRDEVLLAYKYQLMTGVHPDDYDAVAAQIAQAIAADGVMHTKYRLRHKSGTYVWMQISARFVKADDGDWMCNCYYADLSAQEKKNLTVRETMPYILTAIMESSPNLDFAKDKDFRYIFCSPSFARFAGQTEPGGVVGKTDFELFPPQTAEQFRRDDQKLFEDGASLIDYTEPIPSADGVQHYSVTSKYILRDSTGEILGLYGSGRDVTDTRAALDRLQLLTDSIPGGIATYAVSPDGIKLTYFNDGFCAMLGATREEYAKLAAESVNSRVFPEDLPRLMEQVKRLYDTGAPIDCTYRNRRIHGGGFLTINFRGVLVERSNDTAFVNAVLLDITAQKEAEQQARETAEQMTVIMANIRGGISAVTVGEGGQVRFAFANPRYYEILGYTKEQFEAEVKNAVELVFKEDIDRVLAAMNRVMATRKPDYYEYRCRKRDGSTVYLRCNAACTSITGVGDTVLLSNITDITELKQNEQRIEKLNNNARMLMNDTPGGFCRMALHRDAGPTLLYMNDGFAKMLGMTQDEVMAAYGGNMYACMNEDDFAAASAETEKAFATGGSFSLKCRVRHKNGAYLWTRVSGRFIQSETGEPILNSYFSDINAEMTEQERQKQLLDNMPYGAALYEYKCGTLSVIHLNRKYWELVERKPEAYGKLNVTNAVHPDDRALMGNELEAAIREKRNISINLHIRCKETEYRLFHIAANIEQRDDGAYLIYAAYEPIDMDALSYQQALPLLLSAVMNATNDFAFAKDRDFRYLTVSPAFLRLAGLQNEREVVGKSDFDLFPAEMAEQFRQNDIAILASGKPMVDYEETIHASEGTTHYCRASKYPLNDANGHIIGLYGVSRDITKERGALEQLQLVNDSVPGGIATYSVKGGEVRITYCNDGFCRLFGGTREGFRQRGELDPIEWVHPDDQTMLLAQISALLERNTPIDCVYRVKNMGGGYKWINQKAVATERRGDTMFFNAMLLDVNERQLINEKLRISEEENTLAIQHSGNLVCRYDVAERTLSMASALKAVNGLPTVLNDVPYEPVRLGLISPETADAYIGFFEAILKGNQAGTVLFQQRYMGEWEWEEAKSSTVFADDGSPVKAVISMANVTDRIEKENIYKKWQQSLTDRNPSTYTLFRTNISHRSDYDAEEGSLLAFDFDHAGADAGEVARAYAAQCVYPEDREKYVAFVNADAMLASYYRGKRSDWIEYREIAPGGGVRWLRLTIDLVEYPNSTDVEAYMMYEDIDEAKKNELQTKELSETDPLTGILNRATFAAKVNDILQASRPDCKHALLMLDIDGFKRVNDVFGHGAGDQTLIDLADGLKAMMRRDDLVARLGGDEFVVFLNGIQTENAAVNKAKQIRAIARKSFSMEVQISASVGITLSPHDGSDFETLYKKADSALYYVKGSGKDNQAMYSESMADEHLAPETDTYERGGTKLAEKKRRMLIVDDSSVDHVFLQNLFRDEFVIEKAKDGNTALIRLRHYGSAISVVLLDLLMPGMDGFAVLEKMQESAELRSIPVIMVSGDESRETCLTAIRKGATDFVTKPVDVDVLRIRVRSAVSKAENERLRAKNSLLEVQSQEQRRYEALLDSPGVTFMEYNWLNDEFTYFPSVPDCLLGAYDNRNLWRIWSADGVADEETVQELQQLISRVAARREDAGDTKIIRLVTPWKQTHRFRVHVRKTASEYQPANRIIITLTDLEVEAEHER